MSNTPEPDVTPEGLVWEGRPLARPEDDVVDQGAGFDMATLLTRRRVMSVAGIGAGALALAACSSSSSTSSATGGASGSSTSSGEIPQETNGPYPADGTNGVNVLEESGIVRSDVTSSLDGGETVDGVPLTFTFTLTDMANGDAVFAGAAVYLWHCDAEGRYSMYTSGVEDETWLRGIQIADAAGEVTFKTIVPGCYPGRWTHFHFEVYPDAESAKTVENAIATSQVAFPQEMLDSVYSLSAYGSSAQNLAQIGGLDGDNIFSDGYDLQMGTFSGDTSSGYLGSLTVAVDTGTEAGAGGGGAPPSGGGPGGGEPPTGTPPPNAPSN